MPENFFGNSIWQDVLETDPMGRQSIFGALMPQSFSPVQQQRASNLFQPAFSTYLGQMGRQLGEISRGERQEQPTSFTDFISNQYDFRRNLLRQPEAGGGRQNLLGFRTQFGY